MRIFKTYILGSALAMALLFHTSCKKEFLEIEPKGSVIAKYTKDYEQLLNANYLLVSYPPSLYFGDEVALVKSFFDELPIRAQRLFKYQERIYEPDQVPLEFNLSGGYIQKLYVFNTIINEVMNSEGGTEVQKKAILAEARVGRAMCNLMFISDFTKPYNATTAGNDLGIPNLTQADVTLTSFSRLSIKESYDQLINDVAESLPDLGIMSHRRKISKLTAYFLLARTYFAMNNYTAAKTNVDLAFLEISKSSIPMALYDYNIVLNPAGGSSSWLPHSGFAFSANKPNASNNAQLIYSVEGSSIGFGFANSLVLNDKAVSLFDATDKRLFLFDRVALFDTYVFPKNMIRPLFNFLATDFSYSLPDLYLMRAEVRARANDLTGAVQDLEALRIKRTSAAAATIPSTIAGNQQALVRFILDERIRELGATGSRWLDMRRLSQDPIYSDHVKYTHQIFDDAGNAVETYTLKPERFALKFGERMLRESKGLEENP